MLQYKITNSGTVDLTALAVVVEEMIKYLILMLTIIYLLLAR